MAIFASVASSGAIADDTTSVDVAHSAVFAGIRPVTRIDQLAIVERHFADVGRRQQSARVEFLAIHRQISDASDKTCKIN